MGGQPARAVGEPNFGNLGTKLHSNGALVALAEAAMQHATTCVPISEMIVTTADNDEDKSSAES